nr:PREDICTED: BTB/POZ domain-containing protein 2-like isoform X2 [Bemisia tabaci]
MFLSSAPQRRYLKESKMASTSSKEEDGSFANNVTPGTGSIDELDWQGTKSYLNESCHHLFENKLLCDVEFVVGSGADTEKIPAHKLILAARSAVFFAMFSEKWSAESSEINVEDVEPAAFKQMLKFLYSDKINLSLETVTAIIYVAEKYAITALKNRCSDFLSINLCTENACNILITSRHFNMDKVVNDSLYIIAKNTELALKAEDFVNIDLETLCLILERSDLRINEIVLFEAVDRWAEEACIKNNRSVSVTHKRQFLKNALFLIRFPVMKPEEFLSKVATSGLLSSEEEVSVLRLFTMSSKTRDCRFSTIPRRSFLVINRFQHEVTGGRFGLSKPATYHTIGFSVTRTIKVIGVGLYGTAKVKYNVEIILQETINSDLKSYKDKLILTGTHYCSDKIFRIFFPEPIEVDPKKCPYRLRAKIKGSYSMYGSGGIQNETTISKTSDNEGETVTISFSNIDSVTIKESDRGFLSNVTCGQIPELLFEL